jgi:hypothetical protein
MRILSALTVVAAVVVCAGCDGCERYSPDTVPKDPGTVVAMVMDQSGAGLRDVWVYVHDIPNSVGSTFSRGRATDAAGVAEIIGIPAGRRRVEVKAPEGYAALEIVSVDIVKGQSVSVPFRLTKEPIALIFSIASREAFPVVGHVERDR